MGGRFNYSYHRSRLEIADVSVLPDGWWACVSDAAAILGVSRQTIRTWYLKRKVRVVRYKKVIRICLDDVSH